MFQYLNWVEFDRNKNGKSNMTAQKRKRQKMLEDHVCASACVEGGCTASRTAGMVTVAAG